MRIGELAERTGASPRSLRYYEEQGLLAAERTSAGQRVYSDDSVKRVELIRLLLAAGVPSRTIAEIVPCTATGRASTDMIAKLDGELDRLGQNIADLSSARDRLTAVIAAAQSPGIVETATR